MAENENNESIRAVWVLVGENEYNEVSTPLSAVEALRSRDLKVILTQQVEIPGPSTKPEEPPHKPHWIWNALALAALLSSFTSTMLWVWGDLDEWGWTALFMLGLAMVMGIIGLPDSNSSQPQKRS